MSALDIGMIFVVLLASAVVAFTGWVILDKLEEVGIFSPELIASGKALLEGLDVLLLFLVFAMCIVSVFLAFLIPSHPIFLVVNILLLIFLIPFSAMLANIYNDIATTPELSEAAGHFPYVYAIFLYLPTITLFIDVIIIVLANAKPGGGVQY